MSVINQVLNQLEQRGEHTAPEQTMVRAVPHGKRNNLTMPLLLTGLALALGLAVWQGVLQRQVRVAVDHGVPNKPVSTAAMPAVKDAPDAQTPPDLRLSFELSTVPLPSSAREVQNTPMLVAGIASPGGQPGAPEKFVPAPPVQPRDQGMPRTSGDVLPMKQVSTAQQADAEFRKANALMQQGRIADAVAGYEEALRHDAGYDAARQALVALLLEGKRGADAERVLQEGLKNNPKHTGFAMLLARMQVERGAVELAAATLEKTLPYADAQADYQAFFAALLQRQNRHKEAITHYQMVLQLVPDNGVWLMGYGISLQAVQRNEDAMDAYRRALETKTLSPELQAFVRQKLKTL